MCSTNMRGAAKDLNVQWIEKVSLLTPVLVRPMATAQMDQADQPRCGFGAGVWVSTASFGRAGREDLEALKIVDIERTPMSTSMTWMMRASRNQGAQHVR